MNAEAKTPEAQTTDATAEAETKGKGKAKEPKEPKGPSIGSVAMDIIRKGATNQEALEAVKKQFPDSSTSLASINWYRTKLRKDGEPVKSSRELKAEAAAASGETKPKGKKKEEAAPEKDPLE